MNLCSNDCRILAYIRTPSPGYSVYLGESVHFALSFDGGSSYTPLFKNYGMLFAKCRFSEENGIVSAGVRELELCLSSDGEYIITGREVIRHQVKNGIFMTSFETEKTGCLVEWRTKDFIKFTEPRLCQEKSSFSCLMTGARPGKIPENLGIDSGDACELSIPAQLAELIALGDIEPRYAKTLLPQRIAVSSVDEIANVKADIIYTDGSRHQKRVRWELDGLDASRPGSYKIEGKIQCRRFDFPVEERPWGDPIVKYYQGKYYFIGTDDRGGNKMFEIRRADSPELLFSEDSERSVILDYTPGKYESTFWAPELHIAGGKMRIFCTLGKGGFDPQSHVMTLRDGGDMLNPADWSEPKRCVMPDGRFLGTNPLGDGKNGITLDMTYFEQDGEGYVSFSFRTWAGTDSGSMLMFAKTDPDQPWMLKSFPVLMSRPEYGWENIDGTDNNEGPHPIVTEDKIFIVYSGGNAAGDTYVLGMLTADRRSDLLDMRSWEKSQRPVLASDFVKGELGCGHNGFFTDEYGDIYITYHGHKTLGNSERIDGIRRVQLKPDGSPHLWLSAEQDLPRECESVSMEVKIK